MLSCLSLCCRTGVIELSAFLIVLTSELSAFLLVLTSELSAFLLILTSELSVFLLILTSELSFFFADFDHSCKLLHRLWEEGFDPYATELCDLLI